MGEEGLFTCLFICEGEVGCGEYIGHNLSVTQIEPDPSEGQPMG